MKLNGTPFTNSATCKGVSFSVLDAPHDIAKIEISGRYPEEGWALNHASHEVVYVIEGSGQLEQRGELPITFQQNDAIHIPPDQPFAWNGRMTIIMSCNPAFTSTQYELQKGEPV